MGSREKIAGVRRSPQSRTFPRISEDPNEPGRSADRRHEDAADRQPSLRTPGSDMLITYVWPYLREITYVTYSFYCLSLYSITCTMWLTFTLSFFYFLKIIPSQPGILTKLKNMSNTMSGGLLLVAEVVSLVGGFLSILITHQNFIKNNSTGSRIEEMEISGTVTKTFNNIVMALNFLPFLISIVTTVVSASLLKHYDGQMKKNIGNLNANVKDYRTAIHTMTALLMFYTITLLIVIIVTLNILDERTWGYCICVTLLLSFPAVQSSLLINANPKLNEELRKLVTIITSTCPMVRG
ncbi:taste receptor type 2 member 116-like [Dendropsophus ebraccatus]|uniref:taste receptor type 2 member 116-like n=1 Tax=Dendropsophus ebraccatus TaxID=150705 RepID=UPI003831C975